MFKMKNHNTSTENSSLWNTNTVFIVIYQLEQKLKKVKVRCQNYADMGTAILRNRRQLFRPMIIHHICHFCSTDKIFCSTQKCVNCNKNHYKTAYIVNLSRAAKFGTRSNLSLIPITKLLHTTNNFVIWSKIACHVKQFCST